jgi:hypothetical protein
MYIKPSSSVNFNPLAPDDPSQHENQSFTGMSRRTLLAGALAATATQPALAWWGAIPIAVKLLSIGAAALGFSKTAEAVWRGESIAETLGFGNSFTSDHKLAVASHGHSARNNQFILMPQEAFGMGQYTKLTGLRALPVDSARRGSSLLHSDEAIYASAMREHYRDLSSDNILSCRDVCNQYGERGRLIVGREVAETHQRPGSFIPKRRATIPVVVAMNGRAAQYVPAYLDSIG